MKTMKKKEILLCDNIFLKLTSFTTSMHVCHNIYCLAYGLTYQNFVNYYIFEPKL